MVTEKGNFCAFVLQGNILFNILANQFLKTQILLFLSNLVGRDEMACKDKNYDLSKARIEN